MPCIFAYYCSNCDDKALIPVGAVGFLSSALLCALRAFFAFAYRTPQAGFFSNYIYFLFAYSLLPIAAVYVLFFCIVKDDVLFRIRAYFPLLCAFFAVYIPYTTLMGNRAVYSGFELFCKPVLYAAMIVASALCVRYAYHAYIRQAQSRAIAWIILFIVVLFVPAVIETLWFVGFSIALWLPLCAVYICMSVCAFFNARTDLLFEKNLLVFLPLKR